MNRLKEKNNDDATPSRVEIIVHDLTLEGSIIAPAQHVVLSHLVVAFIDWSTLH